MYIYVYRLPNHFTSTYFVGFLFFVSTKTWYGWLSESLNKIYSRLASCGWFADKRRKWILNTLNLFKKKLFLRLLLSIHKLKIHIEIIVARFDHTILFFRFWFDVFSNLMDHKIKEKFVSIKNIRFFFWIFACLFSLFSLFLKMNNANFCVRYKMAIKLESLKIEYTQNCRKQLHDPLRMALDRCGVRTVILQTKVHTHLEEILWDRGNKREREREGERPSDRENYNYNYILCYYSLLLFTYC